MAETALLACIFIDILLHLVVESCSALLELGQLVLPDNLSSALIEIDFLIVFRELFGGYISLQHFLFGLFGVFAR
jgi:hypothetical protein